MMISWRASLRALCWVTAGRGRGARARIREADREWFKCKNTYIQTDKHTHTHTHTHKYTLEEVRKLIESGSNTTALAAPEPRAPPGEPGFERGSLRRGRIADGTI